VRVDLAVQARDNRVEQYEARVPLLDEGFQSASIDWQDDVGLVALVVVTLTRITLFRSALAAIRRGTIVYSQESSVAAMITDRGLPLHSPFSVPRVTSAASV